MKSGVLQNEMPDHSQNGPLFSPNVYSIEGYLGTFPSISLFIRESALKQGARGADIQVTMSLPWQSSCHCAPALLPENTESQEETDIATIV